LLRTLSNRLITHVVATLTMFVDVPDGITSFTIRQSPVAVPSTLALAAFRLVGLAW
jgi:hypothetical protein